MTTQTADHHCVERYVLRALRNPPRPARALHWRNGGHCAEHSRLHPCAAFDSHFIMDCWIAGLAIVASLTVSFNAFGQDVDDHGNNGHPEIHDWYRDLKQPGSIYPCCNGDRPGIIGDCRPTRAYIDEDGHWNALLNGRWVLVPPSVVLDQLSPDGASHICADESERIHCFLRGSPKF